MLEQSPFKSSKATNSPTKMSIVILWVYISQNHHQNDEIANYSLRGHTLLSHPEGLEY